MNDEKIEKVIEFTKTELQILRQALQAVSARGPTAARALIALAEKLGEDEQSEG